MVYYKHCRVLHKTVNSFNYGFFEETRVNIRIFRNIWITVIPRLLRGINRVFCRNVWLVPWIQRLTGHGIWITFVLLFGMRIWADMLSLTNTGAFPLSLGKQPFHGNAGSSMHLRLNHSYEGAYRNWKSESVP